MSDLGRLSKLIDAAATSDDVRDLKMKLLEERLLDLEDIVEEICMELDEDSEDTETDTEETKTEIIIQGTTKNPKKKKVANTVVTIPPQTTTKRGRKTKSQKD